MPIAIGAPVARVSTLLVDADLDMGANALKTDTISESTALSGVTLTDTLKAGEIAEAVGGAGTELPDLQTVIHSCLASPSTRVRHSDATSHEVTTTAYTLALAYRVPPGYTRGSSVNVKTSASYNAGDYAQIDIRNNGISQANHTIPDYSGSTWTDAVDCMADDLIEVYLQVAYAGQKATLTLFQVLCDDTIEARTKNEVW